ncbi:ABC transporter ATP-binding protein [Irregularibacter muris]|uniref:ABC transporter ATP-binding protein n=1 Tax=Irregularibacter muris TaxID=1796619 RepID=A0AAE3L0F2_9FIRM|nr:ABC transporter ATP-binding protein [Irregularibacter muris]MCR1899822.1 ABC transporter ATP-binding protein [Irregularibacter muris]
MKAITVKNLQKSYGTNTVLKGISFSVNQGESFALLGVNGAGKTTTLEILEGIRCYDEGEIQIKGKIGVQLQSSSLQGNIKVIEAIRLFSKWNGCKVDAEYLNRLGIDQLKNKQYKELSTGQKRRLHLALSMIGNPDILFLDEPTAGLDVEARVQLHEEINCLKDQGKTILLASHDMTEVEQLCDGIAILKDGEIAFIGTTQELILSKHRINLLQVSFSSDIVIEKLNSCTYMGTQENYSLFKTENLADCLVEISQLAIAQSVSILDIKTQQDNLEKRFMDIARRVKE